MKSLWLAIEISQTRASKSLNQEVIMKIEKHGHTSGIKSTEFGHWLAMRE